MSKKFSCTAMKILCTVASVYQSSELLEFLPTLVNFSVYNNQSRLVEKRNENSFR